MLFLMAKIRKTAQIGFIFIHMTHTALDANETKHH